MFQRLMAIPQEEYLQLTSVQQARQPMTQQFYNMEKRYQEGEQIMEPYKRLVNQSEVLDELKVLKEKMREGIITATPKPFQTRAKTLYQSLQPFIKFNERGEIYDDKGNVIPYSRLEDLVQYAVRDRRRNIKPEAWDYFKTTLQKYNVPKYVLNSDTLKELDSPFMIKSEPSSSSSSRSSSIPPQFRHVSRSPLRKERSKSRLGRAAKARAKANMTMQRKRLERKRSDVKVKDSLKFLKNF